ncbi:hypothetical protein SMSP2_02699 [Limihaloglobus sulfuriphilus]|uniref:Uncharacterized protein n=1 Tax=Limihaloglobus sulfuriphilus TaxID=1851148 RepID=A0A1R7T650_9BACT|nr:hypothetical protein [Limihaloglobus sulfuriphilus]AQQ72316.1 hypothetical protein SMSP2_02699 [Limihaloglobus sulfuriphilus]
MLSRIRKFLLIILLTLLIWVWADISSDVTLENESATISVDRGGVRDVWVSINESDHASIVMDLTGPNSKVQKLQLRNESLDIKFNPLTSNAVGSEPGVYTPPVETILRQSPEFMELGLTLEACEPVTVSIKVENLVKKQLKVVCINENDVIVPNASVKPALIYMYVFDDWPEDKLKAYIKLTNPQQQKASREEITLMPYVELSPKRYVYHQEPVYVSIESSQEIKTADIISGPRIGYTFPADMAGKYEVQVEENVRDFQYMATEEAKEIFRQQPYHLLLEIKNTDAQGEPVTRQLKYNFPPQAYSQGQIGPRENQSVPSIKFRLIPYQ